jgi:hypothetical protein
VLIPQHDTHQNADKNPSQKIKLVAAKVDQRNKVIKCVVLRRRERENAFKERD